jgi:hypothetical protein
MGMMVQFPSPALWHQILSGPPVSREQGTRNPNGGFNDLIHAQLANQNALAGLQPPPPRPPLLQRGQKEARKDSQERERERGRDPRDPHQHPSGQGAHDTRDQYADEQKPLIRAVWA